MVVNIPTYVITLLTYFKKTDKTEAVFTVSFEELLYLSAELRKVQCLYFFMTVRKKFNTSSAWPTGVTFSHTRIIVPFGSMTNVARAVPS